MPHVLLSTYSKYYDAATDTQFVPVLNRATGCYVAVADLDDETADRFAENPAFEILSDDEYLALSRPAPAPEPAPSESGDPLTDQAASTAAGQAAKPGKAADQATDLTGPPAPPSS